VERERARALLESVQRGDVAPDEALDRLAQPSFVENEHGRVDLHRALRQGMPEVIYGPGKTPIQIAGIVRALRRAEQTALATRITPEVAEAVLAELPDGEYLAEARLLWFGPSEVPVIGKGTIAIVCAGTSDLPVAWEAQEVARRFGNKVELLADVGVAGIHRLLASTEVLRNARVVIVVAGMEGALPSVVGGLVDKPVIAVPTSVGYGASFGGLSALLGMLNSCSANVSVVNIDNGFGAAHVATLINRL
jgi:NCAIR mutase (PurE)-related protein